MFEDPIPSVFIPEPPKPTVDANTAEFKKNEEAMPFIDGVIAWFDLAIENTNRIDIAKADAARRKVSVEATIEAYDIVREILEQKKGEFDSMKLTFDK